MPINPIHVGPGVDLSASYASGASVDLSPGAGHTGALVNVPKTIVEYSVAEPFYHEHVQTTPASEWTVTHNLGKRPNVTIFDDDGDEVLLEVDHLTSNSFHVLWPVPMTGTVICS